MNRLHEFLDSLNNPWIAAGVVVLLSLAVAQTLGFILTRWVSRLTRRTQTSVDDQLVLRLHRPVFAHVTIFGLVHATRILLAEPAPSVSLTVQRILWTLAMFVWLRFFLGSLRLLLESLSDHGGIVESRTIPLLDNVGKIGAVGLAGYIFCLIWGVNPTAWLTSAGILGIALGFAAKDTLGNLFSGFFILADTPYQIGDYIVLDSGERGSVTNIGLRSTRLLTRDDIEIVIPNAVIANAKITNETGGPHPKERLRVAVGVAYGTDVDRVVEILETVANEADGICEYPAPRVRFRQFGDSSLDFELLCWIEEPSLRGLRLHELNMEVYKAFAREGVQIPFPQRDVHLYKAAE